MTSHNTYNNNGCSHYFVQHLESFTIRGVLGVLGTKMSLSLFTSFDLTTFLQSLSAIHTIEEINNSTLLPGIKLGYEVCDPCASPTKALHCVEHLLAINGSLPALVDYTDFRAPVKALLGERYSELSIAIAKLLSLYLHPQVTCPLLKPMFT